ncbi:MAG: caspase family protein [Syntrophomonadaceae bacterium]
MGKIILLLIFAFFINIFPQVKGTSQTGRLKSKKEAPKDVTPPEIILREPMVNNGDEITANSSRLMLSGQVKDSGPIKSLRLNEQMLTLSEGNSFSQEYTLEEGLNSFLLTATDYNNNSSSITFSINYIAKNEPPSISVLEPLPGSNNEASVKEKSTVVRVNVSDKDGIKEVSINKLKARLLGKSEYYINLNLNSGINPVTIVATDKKGASSDYNFSIVTRIDKQGPTIKITEPLVSRGIKVVRKSETVMVKGKAEDESGVHEVSINNIKAQLEPDGSFSLNMFLQVGDNKLTVKAIDKGLNATIDTFTITRKLVDVLTGGRYFGLVIGINSYSGYWPSLRCAANDAKEVSKILKDRYRFDSVFTILDKDATRRNIMQSLEWLSNNLNKDDNLLIFYAGHGQFNKVLNKGYWVPVDAASNSVADYIANSEVKTFLAGIPSKHTLLITDACFAGDIFRGGKGETVAFDPNNMEKYYREVYRRQSRLALTSGGVEEVQDNGKDGHSIFTYYLLKALKENKSRYMDASQLYNDLRIGVANNSEQTPMLQVVKDTYDEGGQFIFVLREDE